jgi:ribosomal protein S27AE
MATHNQAGGSEAPRCPDCGESVAARDCEPCVLVTLPPMAGRSEDEPMHPCRHCRALFSPPPGQLRAGRYRCLPCSRVYRAHQRARRIAAGLDPNYRNPQIVAAYAPGYRSRAAVRERRAAQARATRQNPAARPKLQARDAVREALRDGRLTRQPCSECGAAKAQAHHDDYTRRLDIVWLCAKCHARTHKLLVLAGGAPTPADEPAGPGATLDAEHCDYCERIDGHTRCPVCGDEICPDRPCLTCDTDHTHPCPTCRQARPCTATGCADGPRECANCSNCRG